ncbi:hypothetical protein AVEN_146566-1 [Araneus ventricosus]|uniref:Uncharacterized protein n=1 Tax=Araneus ventricosus TaxID=182803 RepID=A0A4Y2UQ19_ARAVE|nr:hypothetical protein AVEN_146566-1 [Araneus ventricosus]
MIPPIGNTPTNAMLHDCKNGVWLSYSTWKHSFYSGNSFLLVILNGCSGLAVRSRLRGRRVPGSKSDSPEDPPCMAPIAGHAEAKCPPAGCLLEAGAQVPSLSSDHGSK